MTSAQIGRELAAARAAELHQEAARERVVRAAAAAKAGAEERRIPGAVSARPARWLGRLVAATLRH